MFKPFGNETQTPPATWRSEPSARGTWSILSTCLITLGLCLWTALHLNIPRYKEGIWLPILRKAGWLLLGLLAPEMVAFTAWYQRKAAKKLDVVMRRELGQHRDPTYCERLVVFLARCRDRGKGDAKDLEMDNVDQAGLDSNDASSQESKIDAMEIDSSGGRNGCRRHQWTTAHSFYALMGGFVFDVTDAEINFLPNARERLTLTPKGLKYLLEHEPHLVPNISKEDLRDKSNASSLAKTLICLQALWFIVQCIIRIAQDLAISLLELNVFAHTVCALLMYYWWWDKPLDIEEPTILRGERMAEMCALMCMRSSPHEVPELPYGVRYGDTPSRNIVETHDWPDEDNLRGYWHWVIKVFHWRLKGIVEKTILGRTEIDDWRTTSKGPIYRKLLECRLQWTANGHGLKDERADRSYQDNLHVVNLDWPSNSTSQTSSITHRSLPSVPTATVNHISYPPQNTGTEGIQVHSSEDAAITCIDGLSLMLGEWPCDYESSLPTKQAYVEKSYDPRGKMSYTKVFVPRAPQPDYAPNLVTLSRPDVVRWQLCARALQRYCLQPLQWIRVSGERHFQDFPASHCVCERFRNWPSPKLFEVSEKDSNFDNTFFLGFCVAGFLYGGLHLLAWDTLFPQQYESMLWRGSGVIIASSGFVCGLILVISNLSYRTSIWQNLKTRHVFWYTNLIFKVLEGLPWAMIGFIISIYCYARAYLVVESFLQLAHLPDSAYAVPSWSQYYPHIT